MLGLSTSNAAQAIGPNGLRGWGAFLAVAGGLTTYATWVAKPALEKLALRWLAFALMAYVAWVITVVPFKQAVMTLTLGLVLVVLAEIRVGYIKLMYRLAQSHTPTPSGGEPRND
jgi:hypothetical protein